uniref:X8 domain-containing protein n=1 Tax=Pyrodinium bahamense TaxID=73915 RepID=A0A6T9AZ96_9DINO
MAVVATKELIKGVSYGPMPCKGACVVPEDDFMSEPAKPLWGPRGRHDLRVIEQLGANTVRLYGNNPANDHRSFLDEAQSLGLGVVVGISDYPYTQMPGNCMSTQHNCYQQIKESYLGNLRKGFVQEDRTYHPALKQVIVINEPDLKAPGMFAPRLFIKAIISAIDGMLGAEKAANVTGTLPNFTATFSFGTCSGCTAFGTVPALGQMWQLRDAMLNPKAYNYTPHFNLARFYRTRFTNSFNTANPAGDVEWMFLRPYESAFPMVPVVIQEYHKPFWNQTEDLHQILAIAQASSVLHGVSFFEFQVRYDKGGSEEDFGMFGLGDYALADFDYFGMGFKAWCLAPASNSETGEAIPQAVASAFGVRGPDYATLCLPDPAKVPLTEAGFGQIRAQREALRMAVLARRVVEHLGGLVVDATSLQAFAAYYARPSAVYSWAEMVSQIAGRPSWANWNNSAACVADRLSDAGSVGSAIGWVCGSMPHLDCAGIPPECRGSVWDTADFVFGAYYLLQSSTSPLEQCYFNGAAIFAAYSSYHHRQNHPSKPQCVPTHPPPTRTTTTSTTRTSTSTSTTTLPPPFAGNCTIAVETPVPYFWDEVCAAYGGGIGCFADGQHIECRYCGAGPFVACPTLPPPAISPRSSLRGGTPKP